MAAPSVWANWSNSSSDVLRPTEDHWRQVREMHRFDADSEQAIWDAPWEDQRQPGMMELTAKGPGLRGHTDNGRSEEGLSEEQIVFEHGVKP